MSKIIKFPGNRSTPATSEENEVVTSILNECVRSFTGQSAYRLFYVEKSVIAEIRESDYVKSFPVDENYLEFVHELGGEDDDIVRFIHPDTGEEIIFVSEDLYTSPLVR